MTRPLRNRLRRLDPEAARVATELSAALVRQGPSVEAGDPALATGWIVCKTARAGDEPIALAPLSTVEGPVALTAEKGGVDAAAAADALDRLDPLIATVERALGATLLPIGVSDVPPVHHWCGTVGLPSGERLLLAASALHSPPLGPVPDFARLPRTASAPLRVVVDGPALPVARLAAIEPGALILVRHGPATGALACGGRHHLLAIDLRGRQARLLSGTGADPMTDQPDLAIPLTFVLDAGTMPLSQAAALAPGALIPLPPAGDSLPVTIDYGGARLGRGELVAVGDGYGVLVTEITTRMPDPA